MPIYEYECSKCNRIVEKWQGLSEAPLTDCPDCAGALKKIISSSSFQLKGGGWYADGYKSTSGCAGKASSASSAAAASSAPSSEPSSGCSAEKKASCGCAS